MFKPGDKVVEIRNPLTKNRFTLEEEFLVKVENTNFHLNYINLDVTVAVEVDKLEEEVKEVIDAVLNRDTENILEESMDVIQVILGLISTLNLKEEFLEYNSQHQDKLRSRGHILSELV